MLREKIWHDKTAPRIIRALKKLFSCFFGALIGVYVEFSGRCMLGMWLCAKYIFRLMCSIFKTDLVYTVELACTGDSWTGINDEPHDAPTYSLKSYACCSGHLVAMWAKPLQSGLINNACGIIANATHYALINLLSAVSWASHIQKKNCSSSIALLSAWADKAIFN